MEKKLIKQFRQHKMSKKFSFFDVLLAIILAVGLHLVLLFLWFNLNSMESSKMAFKPQSQYIRLVSRPKKLKPEATPKKQLVLVPKSLEEKKPERADFVAEHDQKVKEETKSSKTGPDDTLTSKPYENFANKEMKINSNRLMPDSKVGEKFYDASKKMNLVPSAAELSKLAGMPFNDHLEEVEEDAETRLNTFQWKHATYFNRIKERVSQTWSPISQIKRYDPNGALIGQQDRFTGVLVTIDKNGVVVSVSVQNESGVYYLDDEAVRAFKEASPFPHPPEVVFGGNNVFRFAFGFHITINKGFSLDFD